MKAVERLETALNDAERQISELETKVANYEYKDNWHWRMFRVLSKEENIGLPIPRLEIRYNRKNEHRVVADYGLVYEHLLGEIIFMPISSTGMDGFHNGVSEEDLRLPFRDGAHIKCEMWNLKLRGFVVNGRNHKEIELTRDGLPSRMLSKITEGAPPDPQGSKDWEWVWKSEITNVEKRFEKEIEELKKQVVSLKHERDELERVAVRQASEQLAQLKHGMHAKVNR